MVERSHRSSKQVRYGDYDGKLQRVVDNLAQAQQHAANEHEEKMMGAYVAHFRGVCQRAHHSCTCEPTHGQGDINDHKEAQKHWIKDIGPVVEYVTQVSWTLAFVNSQCCFVGVTSDSSKAIGKNARLCCVCTLHNLLPCLAFASDPSGGRGEFEGFVAVVNKQTSAVFAKLVDGATTYLPKLPWDAAYEKDQVLHHNST